MYISALSFLATAAAVTGGVRSCSCSAPRATSFSLLFRLAAPSRSHRPPLSDHYRVISATDFRVASSRTHAHATMISALICSARHSTRIPPAIPSGDKAAAGFLFSLFLRAPGARQSVVAHSNVSISVRNFRRETREENARGNISENIFRSDFTIAPRERFDEK